MKLLIIALLVVSTSAFFMPQQRTQSSQTKSNAMAAMGGQRMPDMGLVMQMVRQILMLLLPKLMANPSLMTALSGGKPPGKPQVPPMTGGGGAAPGGGAGMGAGGAPAIGGGMGGGMNNGFFPGRNPMGGFGGAPVAGGYFPPPSGDKMKDMRLMHLLQDPTVGLANDPYISQFIPRGRMPYGWSLPDIAKDHIQYAISNRIRTRGMYTPKEREIISLIGDPIEMMPSIFGPGSNIRPRV